MIIKRRKNEEEFLLEEKLFADVNCKEDLIDNGYFITIPLEVIKTIEMPELDNGHYLIHWIVDMPYNIFKFAAKYNVSPQLFFYGVLEDNLNGLGKYLGQNNIEKFIAKYNWSDSDNFIAYLLKLLIYGDPNNKITDPEQAKYSAWFRGNSMIYGPSDYKAIFKFIALSLSGQIEPLAFDFWQESNQLRNIKVNYGIIKYRNREDFARILSQCIYVIQHNYIHPNLEKFI